MADSSEPWGICGGWALDLFLGRITRPHQDVEAAILRSNQLQAQRRFLSRGWTLEVAHEGNLRPWEEGEFLEPPLHTIWCSHKDEAGLEFFELLLNEHAGRQFHFRRCPSIRINLADALEDSAAGISILAPQIVLLYMATEAEPTSHSSDLINALPDLDAERRRWLQASLNTIDPDHDWLEVLNRWGA